MRDGTLLWAAKSLRALLLVKTIGLEAKEMTSDKIEACRESMKLELWDKVSAFILFETRHWNSLWQVLDKSFAEVQLKSSKGLLRLCRVLCIIKINSNDRQKWKEVLSEQCDGHFIYNLEGLMRSSERKRQKPATQLQSCACYVRIGSPSGIRVKLLGVRKSW